MLNNEIDNHINVLELRAIFLAQKSLVLIHQHHVVILTDNTTTMAYIHNMGGTRSKQCSTLAKQIWQWAQKLNIWLTQPETENAIADRKSRQFHDHLEWLLSSM